MPPPAPISPLPAILQQIQSEVSRRAAALSQDPGTRIEDDVSNANEPMMEWAGPPLQWGEKVSFGRGGTGTSFLREDWSSPEEGFIWSDGGCPTLALPPCPMDGNILWIVTGFPFTNQEGFQVIRVRVNGMLIAVWRLRDPGRYCALLPVAVVKPAMPIRLTFEIGFPTSPKARGLNDDGRRLGLALQTLEITRF